MATTYNEIVIANLSATEIEKAFKNALEDNELTWHNERGMLVDFLYAQQTDKDEYLKSYFNIETDPNKEPDYPHNLILTQTNITAKVIGQKAKSYKLQPIRMIDGKPSDDYTELLLGAGVKSTNKLIDRLTWLLGDHCVVVIADATTKKLRFDNPLYYRPVFKDGDNVNPVGVTYPIGVVRNQKRELVEAWNYWDAEQHLVLESGTWNILKQEPNPHGCFNAIFTHRTKPFRSHWTQDASDLVCANRDINVILTAINNAARLQGFPTLAAIGMEVKDASKVKQRFDKLFVVAPGLDNQTTDLKYLNSGTDWNQLVGLVKSRIEMAATTWNVDIRWNLEGQISSGVALKILSVDNLSDISDTQELYEEYLEVPLFEKLKAIGQNVEWVPEIAGKTLTLDWQEEPFIETPSERSARLKTDIEQNLTNPIDELKAENPDLNDEEAARRYLRNVAVNRIASQGQALTLDSLMAALDPSDEEIAGLIAAPQPEPPGVPTE